MTQPIRILVSVLAIWVGLVFLVWLAWLPHLPQKPSEWLLLLLIGPPAYVLLALVGEALGLGFRALPGVRHLHRFAERRTETRSFSWLRVLAYLCTTLLALSILGAVAWALNR